MGVEPAAHDVWAVGTAYEAYVGRWSRLVAREFVRWLGVAPDRRWLDVGCGAGALTEAIAERAEPRAVLGVDRSKGFVAHARARAGRDRVSFLVADAQALPVATGSFDAVVSGLVLNFVPEPSRMVSEMARAAGLGSAVALYVWDYAAGTELIRRFWDAARALDPAAAALDEAVRFPSCAPAPLGALFAGAGLSGIETRAIDVPTRFRGFDDYWSPFLGGQGPAPAYAMSLPEDRRIALREAIRRTLPVAPDGSIRLTARAWAVRGSIPPRLPTPARVREAPSGGSGPPRPRAARPRRGTRGDGASPPGPRR
jgi:SAM-dependent methyltransferase